MNKAGDAFLQGRYGDVLSPGTFALAIYEAIADYDKACGIFERVRDDPAEKARAS